jgi:NAD(P)H dehydrogenase (quinone)
MPRPTLLVTGASGQLGRRVIELLLDREHGPIIATTRTPAALANLSERGVSVRPADFDDEASLFKAFQGAERALLVSTDALDKTGRRLAQHTRAVHAMQSAGVKHVVYTSLPKPVGSPITIAGDHAGTEAALHASTLEFSILRNNLYADLLLMTLPAAVASGQLIDAREAGAVAYVTREDCARVAAATLADPQYSGRNTVDVTGGRSWTSDQLAALLSESFDRKVTHGLPRIMAELYASFDQGIARGDLAEVTDTVTQRTGRAPEDMRAFLLSQRAAFGR